MCVFYNRLNVFFRTQAIFSRFSMWFKKRSIRTTMSVKRLKELMKENQKDMRRKNNVWRKKNKQRTNESI